MASLDTVSIAILLGSLLVLAGILSSLVALRFGAPLLLVFLIVGMLAGEGGPDGLRFSDVDTAYLVGSVALALILFDGGLRTRIATFRSVLAPAVTLATEGVLITTVLTAPVAKWVLGIGWTEALLMGAVVASTDAAAVFLLINAGGLPAPARARHARSGIRHQRSLRGFPSAIAGRNPGGRRPELVARGGHAGARYRSWLCPRLWRRPRHRACAQPCIVGARAACALRGGERIDRLCLRQCAAFIRLSRGLSRRSRRRQPADARA